MINYEEKYNEFVESNNESLLSEIEEAKTIAKLDEAKNNSENKVQEETKKQTNNLRKSMLETKWKIDFKTPDSINHFYTINRNWKIVFQLDHVKSYLNDVHKRLSWMKVQKFQNLSKENNFTWTILAIQIALKAMGTDPINPKKYNIWKINWKYNDETKDAIKSFQSNLILNWVDWIPWKETIWTIIKSLDNFMKNRKEYTRIKNTIQGSWKLISEFNINRMTDYIINWNLWTNTDPLTEKQIDDLIINPTPFTKNLQDIIKEYKENWKKLKILNEIDPFSKNTKFDKFIIKYSKEYSNIYKIDPALIKIMIKKESWFRPQASSWKAKWLMQLTPSTAEYLGVHPISDPEQNIKWGIKYMSQLLNKYNWDISLALAAYNAGPWNVKKYGNKIPPFKETKNYVKYIMNTYNNLA